MSPIDSSAAQPTSKSTGIDDDWITARADGPGFRTDIAVGRHTLIADETAGVGADAGPSPYAYLLVALGSCTAMTVRMYATRKEWPLESVIVRLRDTHTHAADCADCEKRPVGLRRLDRQIELLGALTDEQRQRLLLIADRCPVKQTLSRGIEISDSV
jgi:putative redox protein